MKEKTESVKAVHVQYNSVLIIANFVRQYYSGKSCFELERSYLNHLNAS